MWFYIFYFVSIFTYFLIFFIFSNGSTRTGLYVAVSLLLERLRAEQKVDVFQTVKTLQAQRYGVLASTVRWLLFYGKCAKLLIFFWIISRSSIDFVIRPFWTIYSRSDDNNEILLLLLFVCRSVLRFYQCLFVICKISFDQYSTLLLFYLYRFFYICYEYANFRSFTLYCKVIVLCVIWRQSGRSVCQINYLQTDRTSEKVLKTIFSCFI